MVKQEDLNAYFGRELKRSADMLEHLGDYMANVKDEFNLLVNMLLWLTLK